MRFPAFCTLLFLGACIGGCGAATPLRPPAESTAPAPKPAAGEAREAPGDKGDVALDYENNVYFDFAQTAVDSRGLETLGKHADRLLADGRKVVTLVGHTDHLGSSAYNQAVCEERLDAVAEILKARGVARRQIRRIAVGNEEIGQNRCRAEACRRSLRRVELVYEKSPPR